MKNTPHINPTADIAETILLPGDPLRSKFIAEEFLTNVKQFNSVRNILGFTGNYKNKTISVMATGMGMPSMGIYSYELINFFGVKNLIRVGSCGSMRENIEIGDLIIAMGSSTDSNYAKQFESFGNVAAISSWKLLKIAYEKSQKLNSKIYIGNVLSSDIFYREQSVEPWIKLGILGVEMESAALYLNAARYGADALCILTVSDNLITHKETTAKERQTSFTNMIELALETAIDLDN